MLPLQEILFSQGFGTRRVCCGLVQQGLVQVGPERTPCDDPWAEFETEGLVFTVQGRDWAFHERAYLMLHKPAGHECSQKPSNHPSIFSLLPGPLRARGGGRYEHLVVGGVAVHLHRTCLEVAAGTGRRTGAPGHHQQGQQWQPARERSKHGDSHEGEVASMVVRCGRPGIVRRITAGAGSWR